MSSATHNIKEEGRFNLESKIATERQNNHQRERKREMKRRRVMIRSRSRAKGRNKGMLTKLL